MKARAKFACVVTRLSVLLGLLFLCSCRETIVHNLSERDANRLLTRLHDVSIEATKEKQPDGNWSIATTEDEALRAIKFLDDARFFRREELPQDNEESVLASPEERRARTNRLLARELEASIRSIDGILEAHVHLNIPPLDPIFGTVASLQHGSGSVVATVAPGNKVMVGDLQALVSGATGIAPKDVSVLLADGDIARDGLLQPKSHEVGNESTSWWAAVLLRREVVLLIGVGLLLLGFALLHALQTSRGVSSEVAQ
ncbi:MAG: hypothetical protein K1X79_02555 [Oligoflexia bacterium]|nr:hypothetical protein [Oligoflexia bacterium]